jgi:hypothetical protein
VPSARGIVFDLPHGRAGAPTHLQAAGIARRCDVVPGDFFHAAPAGADAYILKNVVPDWTDERAVGLLRTCRAAMPDRARLLLVNRLLPDRIEASPAHQQIA